MKIDDQPPIQPADLGVNRAGGRRPEELRDARARQSTAPEAAGPTTNPAATVELSPRSRELHEARRIADAAPEVRAEKVADVRQRLETGAYQVDATRIAQGILDRRA